MVFLTKRCICSFLMLHEVFEDEDFLHMSSECRLVNISGTVKWINLKCLQEKDIGLPV
jgi:hypothetical protein